jgi:hypothetical protein
MRRGVVLVIAAVGLLAVGHFVGIRLMAQWRVMESLMCPGAEAASPYLELALAFVALRLAALFLGPGLAIVAAVLLAERLAQALRRPIG